MKNKIFISAALAASCLALTGCSDSFLDAEQKSDISADDYFATESGFENLAAAPYYKLKAIYGGDPAVFCSGTDLYDKGRSNYSNVSLSTYSTLNATESSVLSLYEACYDGIQQANCVIKYAGNDESRQLRANEAKVLKAYYYYLLTQQFGGVPIVKDYIESVQLDFPKSSQEEVYEYILSLLKEVEGATVGELPDEDSYISKQATNYNNGRVSKRFLNNLFAKVYLAYAWDKDVTATDAGLNEGQAATATSKERFELAAQYADKAIGTLDLNELSFADMWNIANENNEDIFFSVKYTFGISGQDDTKYGNQQQAQFGNYYNDDASDSEDPGQSKYTNSQYAPSDKLIYLFEAGDARYQGTFMETHLAKYKYIYTSKTQSQGYNTVYGYYPAWYEDLSKLTDINQQGGFATTIISSSSNPSVYITGSKNRKGEIVYKSGTRTYETSRTTTGTSMCVRKFDDYTTTRNGTSAVSYHDIVLAHLSETYLLAAEAYYMAGNSDKARQYVNIVRARSGASVLNSWSDYVRHYSDYDGQTLDASKKYYNDGTEGWLDLVPSKKGVTDLDPIDIILDERARELCGEYYRWMDLRRTKRLIDYNVKYNSGVASAEAFKGKDGNNKWFRPIPTDEINLNQSLTDADQNPGY